MPSSTRSSLLTRIDRDAVREGLPLLVPAVPFGFILGLEINNSLLPTEAGFSTSAVIFAGAAQLAVVTLAGTVSMVTVVVTAMVINARHIMYSAAVAPLMTKQPLWFRLLAPFVLIDQIFALAVTKRHYDAKKFRRYYLTLGAMFFLTWQCLTILGIVFGDVLPTSLGLGLAPALMFAGIVVTMITGRPAAIAAVTAVVVTLITLDLPNRTGLLVGALAGVLAGYLAEGRQPQ